MYLFAIALVDGALGGLHRGHLAEGELGKEVGRLVRDAELEVGQDLDGCLAVLGSDQSLVDARVLRIIVDFLKEET